MMSNWYGQNKEKRKGRQQVGNNGSSPPMLLELRSSKRFIVAGVTLAIFSDMILYSVIVPAIPFLLSDRIRVPGQDVQYWVSVSLATFGVTMFLGSPLSGWLADSVKSRRWPYLLGLAALVAGSLMLCLATSLPVLFLGRALQGLAAALTWVVGIAILVDTYGSDRVGEAVGMVAVGSTLALFLGPMLGGILYERAGYYAVYYLSFGLIAADILWRFAMIEQSVAARWLKNRSKDRAKKTQQQQQESPECVEQVVVICQQQHTEQTCVECGNSFATLFSPPPRHDALTVGKSPAEPNSLAVSVVEDNSQWVDIITNDSIPCRVQGERQQHRQQTAPQTNQFALLHLLRSRRFLAALWATFINAVNLTSFDTVLPLHVHAYFGWTSTGAGLIFLAIVVPSLVIPLVGRLVDRHRGRHTIRLAAAGSLLLALPLFALLRFVDGPPSSGSGSGAAGRVALLVVLLALIGLTESVLLVVSMAELSLVVAERERRRPGIYGPRGAYAQAYGLFNLCFSAGNTAGPLLSGLLVQKAGWPAMCLVLGLLSAASAVPIGLFTGGALSKKLEGDGKGLGGEVNGGVGTEKDEVEHVARPEG